MYMGTFTNNNFHGIGVMAMAMGEGCIYQGNFANGLYHGIGTLEKVEDKSDNKNECNVRDDDEEEETSRSGKKELMNKTDGRRNSMGKRRRERMLATSSRGYIMDIMAN